MLKLKVVLVGTSGVGKTSLITRYCFDTFHSDLNTTVGIDFMSKKMVIQDKTINLQFWDTAGQEKYKWLVPAYIRDCAIALVVFDVTSKDTFEEAKQYIEDVKSLRGDEALIALIGNKIDLLKEKSFDTSAKDFAKQSNLLYFEVSAKDGTNINSMFQTLGENVLPLSKSFENPPVVIVKEETSEKKCSC